MTNEQRFWVILIIAYIIGVLSATKCSGQTTSLVRVQHDSFVSYYDTAKHCPAIMVYMLDRSHFAGSEKLSGRHLRLTPSYPGRECMMVITATQVTLGGTCVQPPTVTQSALG